MAAIMTLPVERRRNARTQLQMTLRSIRLDPECGDVVDCLHMQNISRSGLGAIVDRPFYPGQRVVLFLPVQNQGRKNVYARVVRCHQYRHSYQVGLEFETLSTGNWCCVNTPAAAAA